MNESAIDRENERIRENSSNGPGVFCGEDAFMGLLQTYQTQLMGYIFCLVHHLSDAEDIFQKTAVTLWEKFDEFEQGSNFLAWAKAVARNKALTFLRDNRRERSRFSDTLVEQLAERPLWTGAESAGRLLALRQCRQKLGIQDQELLRQCYGSTNTKIQDAASTLGRTVDSIYVSLSRIRRVLSECIRRTLTQEEFSR